VACVIPAAPSGTHWRVAVDTAEPGRAGEPWEVGGHYLIEGRSSVVLAAQG
jgi:hypothetical protein